MPWIDAIDGDICGGRAEEGRRREGEGGQSCVRWETDWVISGEWLSVGGWREVVTERAAAAGEGAVMCGWKKKKKKKGVAPCVGE